MKIDSFKKQASKQQKTQHKPLATPNVVNQERKISFC